MAKGTACVLKRVPQQQQRSEQQSASKTQTLDALQGLTRRQSSSREQAMASELAKMMQQMARGRNYQNQNNRGNGYQPWEDSTSSLLRSLMGDKSAHTPKVRFADQSGWGGGNSSGGNSNDWSGLDLFPGPKVGSFHPTLLAALIVLRSSYHREDLTRLKTPLSQACPVKTAPVF